MRAHHDARAALAEIIEAASNAERFLAGVSVEQLQDSVEKTYLMTAAFTIMGEAAGRLPQSLRSRHAQVPWQDVIRMRHRIVHGYDQVDWDVVWTTVNQDLPPLRAELAAILAQLDQEDPA